MSYAEAGTGSVATYGASDPGGGGITWSLPNTSFETDRGDFDISSSGVLTFDSSPDYEDPDDSNDDNVYRITVRASDGGLSASRNVTVTVTNRAPAITSGPSSVSYDEGGTGSVATYGASDPGGGIITWSLPNTTFETDRGDFDISSSGVLTFDSSPDYEDPDDSNDDNVYKITVRASDGGLSASRNVTVTVTDVNEPPAKITGLTGTPGTIRGTIDLDWDSATGADDYEVAEWRQVLSPIPISHWVVLDDSEVTIDSSDSSAVVAGLEGGETYRHRVRGVRGTGSDRVEGSWSDHVDTTLTLPDKVEGLTGTPGTNHGDHGEISLAWDPAGGATGYRVRQKKPRPGPLPDTWIELPGEGFGVAVVGATATVSNLDPDKTYVYQVRGTNVHGEGEWSDSSAEIAVRDERPATPQGLALGPVVGNRGVSLRWQTAAGAQGYEVGISPAVNSQQTPPSGVTAEVTGLTPGRR